jgi:aryl-alcohol dehydrogenase-like predicted oxidoreductase
VPYFPLAGGLLTGKYRLGEEVPPGVRGYNNANFQKQLNPATLGKIGRLEKFAAERDHTMVHLAIAWLLAKPMVCSVISGATQTSQIDANIGAADWTLTPGEVAEIEAIAAG